MDWIKGLGLIGAWVGVAAGVGFLFLGAGYSVHFLTEAGNPERHHYLLGITLSLVAATGALLLASMIAGLIRPRVSAAIFRVLAWPGLVVGAAALCLYLAYIVFMLFG